MKIRFFSVIIMLLFSCQSKMTEENHTGTIDNVNATNDVIDDSLNKLILSEDLRKNLLYVIDSVNTFPNWDFPIIYTVLFFENTVEISVNKTITEIVSGDSNYGYVGYYKYGDNIIQFIDYQNSMNNMKLYNIDMLTNMNDTILSSLNYKNGINEDHIKDLNLGDQRIYLKLKYDDSCFKVVEDHIRLQNTNE